jgi:hypothetical protein
VAAVVLHNFKTWAPPIGHDTTMESVKNWMNRTQKHHACVICPAIADRTQGLHSSAHCKHFEAYFAEHPDEYDNPPRR